MLPCSAAGRLISLLQKERVELPIDRVIPQPRCFDDAHLVTLGAKLAGLREAVEHFKERLLFGVTDSVECANKHYRLQI